MNSSQKKATINKQLNALAIYRTKGIDVVKAMFPEYVNFVLENKDRSIEEVRASLRVRLTKAYSR